MRVGPGREGLQAGAEHVLTGSGLERKAHSRAHPPAPPSGAGEARSETRGLSGQSGPGPVAAWARGRGRAAAVGGLGGWERRREVEEPKVRAAVGGLRKHRALPSTKETSGNFPAHSCPDACAA